MNLILICGCGHTGTSILARIIGEHSNIFFVTLESGMFLANRYYLEDSYLREFTDDAKKKRRRLILEKTPRHIWHVDYIRRKYPGTKFILTTRDGRNTVASLYERTKDIGSSVTRYQDDSILTLRQIGLVDTRLVRYEDLVKNPTDIVGNICSWLGLEFEPKMLQFHLNSIEWNLNNPFSAGEPDRHDLLRNRQVNSPLQDSSQPWKERLPEEHHGRVREFFSDGGMGYRIMQDFGYRISWD